MLHSSSLLLLLYLSGTTCAMLHLSLCPGEDRHTDGDDVMCYGCGISNYLCLFTYCNPNDFSQTENLKVKI